MPAWICCNCGVQSAETAAPPDKCPICEDEREAVRWDGQQWTTMDRLAANHAADIREEEPGLIGVGTSPSFAIGQRALVVRTPNGNVLWDWRGGPQPPVERTTPVGLPRSCGTWAT